MKYRWLLLLALSVAAVSCERKDTGTKLSIEYVREILSNPVCGESLILGRNRVPDVDACISVTGDSASAEFCSSILASADFRDNVHGSYESDDLPDFAGETVEKITDEAYAPYGDYVSSGRTEELRAAVVSMAVSSLDTVSHLSLFDVDGLGVRQRTKIVVLSSPYAAAYGLYDVDSLFTASGCKVQVVCPTADMIRAALDSASFCMGVITTEELVRNRVHERFFLDEIQARGMVGAKCVSYAPGEDVESPLFAFLDDYVAKGNTKPIDAIVVDDMRVSRDAVCSDLARIADIMNEEYITYSDIISPKIRVFGIREELCSRCYGILRSGNLFTHRISVPLKKQYVNVFNRSGVGTMIIENQ